MRSMPDSSIDSIVTDPPYGLGFMGKEWDALPPGEDWARECLRVLKPGGHLLAFGGTRTWHRLAVAVEDAGFEIRDSIAWMYGSGFPKHRATLKPAFEPIVMARKPYKGSLATNEATHGTGALNIDASRIGTTRGTPASHSRTASSVGVVGIGAHRLPSELDPNMGRWPANVILDEPQADALDEQSGILKDGVAVKRNGGGAAKDGHVLAGGWKSTGKDQTYGGSGGASRFFYVAKAPKKERPVVDGVTHPTVKPLSLMRWLVKLVTPTDGVVLDPFAGSGTTIEAALLEGFKVVGIEKEAEYLPLIQTRVERSVA